MQREAVTRERDRKFKCFEGSSERRRSPPPPRGKDANRKQRNDLPAKREHSIQARETMRRHKYPSVVSVGRLRSRSNPKMWLQFTCEEETCTVKIYHKRHGFSTKLRGKRFCTRACARKQRQKESAAKQAHRYRTDPEYRRKKIRQAKEYHERKCRESS